MAADVAAKIAEAGISAVPLVGGPIAVFLAAGVQTTIQRKRDRWFADLAQRLETLIDRVEGLSTSEEFADAVMTAVRLVDQTSQEEKLGALRNAVVNSVLAGAPDQDIRSVFLVLIGDLMPTHLALLRLLDDPRGWFRDHPDLKVPTVAISSSRQQLVRAAVPAVPLPLAERFVADLTQRGLLSVSGLGTMMTAQGMWQSATTDLGRRFLAFISDPAAP